MPDPFRRIRNLAEKWERHVPTWHSLNRIGRWRVLRSSYFWIVAIPLFANALSHFPNMVEIHLWGSTYKLVVDLPFNWKMFYFSAVAFALATLLNSWKCPPIIKDYDFFDDYQKDGNSELMLKMDIQRHAKDKVNLSHEMEHCHTFIRSFCKTIDPDASHPPTDPDTLMTDFRIQPDRMSDAFHFTRGVTQSWYPIIRLCCVVLYTVGLLLLSCVFIRTFIFVIKFVYTH